MAEHVFEEAGSGFGCERSGDEPGYFDGFGEICGFDFGEGSGADYDDCGGDAVRTEALAEVFVRDADSGVPDCMFAKAGHEADLGETSDGSPVELGLAGFIAAGSGDSVDTSVFSVFEVFDAEGCIGSSHAVVVDALIVGCLGYGFREDDLRFGRSIEEGLQG